MPVPSVITFRDFDAERNFPLDVLFGVTYPESTPAHSHECGELTVVLDGEGLHVVGEDSYRITGGDVFVIHPGTSHSLREPNHLVLANIVFDLSQLPLPLTEIAQLPGFHALFTLEPSLRRQHGFESRLRLSPRELGRVGLLIEHMTREIEESGPGYRAVLLGLFTELIVLLSRCYATPKPPTQSLLRLGEVLAAIESSYASPVTLEQLASMASTSPNNLMRMFKEGLGMSPISYVISRRIAKAQELLLNTPLTVTEVAFQVGFEDSGYFCRQFKQVTGFTPREFRKGSK